MTSAHGRVAWWDCRGHDRRGAGEAKARATTIAAVSFLVALAGTRAIRILQVQGRLAGGQGLTVAGRHIHHFVWGLALVAGQAVAGTVSGIPLDDVRRAVPLGVGVAVAADEFDIIFGVEHWRLAQQHRPLADVALAAIGAAVAVTGATTVRRLRQTLGNKPQPPTPQT